MATDTSLRTETPVNDTKIPCHSKRFQDLANERLFSTVDEVIGKNIHWSDDQKDRVRRRFRENDSVPTEFPKFTQVYKNALQENCTLDGQPWAEAVDDADTTKEFEPVDLKRKGDTDQMAAELDALVVSTVAKRREVPSKLTQQLAKRLQCLHTATEQYKPVIPKSIDDNSPLISSEDEQYVNSTVTASSDQLSVLSRLLPDLEDKSSRLEEAISIHDSLATNKTHYFIRNPHKNESKMAASLTPLKAPTGLTPTPHSQNTDTALKRQQRTAHIHSHPIKRYKHNASDAINST